MIAKPLQISLRLLNALQVAIAAAAGFAAALLVVVPATQPGVPLSVRDSVGAASRAYVAAITERLRQTIGDARNAALALRDDEGLLSADQRAARLREWLGLNPIYRDGLLVASDGTVLAAQDERLVGRSVARQTWFLRGRATGVSVVTEETDAEAPFGAVVALGERGQGGLLRLDAAPSYFTGIEEDVRRTLTMPETLGFVVATADSRVLVGTPSPFRAASVSATTPMRAAAEIGSPGWLVTAQAVPSGASLAGSPDWRMPGIGLALVACAAALGFVAGTRLTRPLRRLLTGEEADEAVGARTWIGEFAALSDAFAGQRRSTGLLVAGVDSEVARLKARLTTFETVSGWACCEIDPETGRTLLNARSEGGGEGAPFAACFVAADRPLLERTRLAALAADGPHDAVLRLHDWPDQQVQVRLLCLPDVRGDRRLFALMRKLPGHADATLPQPVEPRRNLVLRRVTDGIVHEFNDVLTVVLTNLALLTRRHSLGDEQDRLVGRAMVGARRGAALTRRMLHLVRGDETDITLAETDLATTFEAYLPFLEANALGDMPVLNRIPAGLPTVLCSERVLELLLLNLAFHIRDACLAGFAIAAAEGVLDDPNAEAPPTPYVRILVSSGRRPETALPPSETGRTLTAAAALVAESGGEWHVVRDGSGGEPFLAEFWLPAARPAAARLSSLPAVTRKILLVESDGLVRASVAEVIADLGHGVVQAASGVHALEVLARDAAFDAMIVDQSMPVMAGLQLAATVVERYPDIRIILASPHGQLPSSADAFLRIDKPFRNEDLQVVLDVAINRARAA
ncbi:MULTISPECIES: response regulator [unclassified Methylobacterium]|uniref:response regulator n=1 Tax=unclassified Methylobacterium TaxID=2615210 RepID=UPI0011C1EE2E|nr:MULTISPECIES: response regulator [unclassified Methylobacterium]QEE41262.1 response regulator [Methylobacterium sp. WL1]TXN53423.1 response regulator [Methylobacterium sp. WL2]